MALNRTKHKITNFSPVEFGIPIRLLRLQQILYERKNNPTANSQSLSLMLIKLPVKYII